MAPSLHKGKARAEEHKGKVITSKKKSRTRIRLTQQEVINKYIEDHQEDWETKSAGAQQKFISNLEAAWDAPSDTESESEQSYTEVMSQPGSSGRNTPTASGSHLPPTGGPAPTLTDLTRVVLDLGVAVGHITTQLNTLCYDPGSDFSGRLLTGYDYGTPKVSSHISHGQSSQSAE